MTLIQLKYLIEVADKGSINRAAQSLYISQPSLSNAIREIENEIQIKIFKRTSKGIKVTLEGAESLLYARQIVEQAELLEKRYVGQKPTKLEFSVSTQHCAATVISFGELIKKYGNSEFEFQLKESRSIEVIDDVINNKSEIGIIYINEFNEKAIKKKIKEGNLELEEMFAAKPHVLVSKNNELSEKNELSLKDLEDYPYISFGQDEYNLFHFSEEILSAMLHKRSIKVSERATMFNLLSILNGFTISTGIISERLRKQGIVPIDLKIDNIVKVGVVKRKFPKLSELGEKFIDEFKNTLNSML